MSTAVANSQDLPYSKPVALSLVLHMALAGAVVVSAYLHLRGDQWNGVGDSTRAKHCRNNGPQRGHPNAAAARHRLPHL